MKNFNLLLATTAILSMGAMAVNATNPTDTLNASVYFVRESTIAVTQDLHFGTWIPNEPYFTLEMDSSGTVTPDTEGYATKVADGRYGLVVGAPCESLQFTGTFDKNFSISGCARHIKLQNITAVDTIVDPEDQDRLTCKIIADLEYDDDDCSNPSMYGAFNFEVTVTALLDNPETTNP